MASQASRKKRPMKTAEDVIHRIQWDSDLKSEHFVVGYTDRILGLVEEKFDDFCWNDYTTVDDINVLAIPRHRIQYFKYRNAFVWHRGQRLDLVFGSTRGEPYGNREMRRQRSEAHRETIYAIMQREDAAADGIAAIGDAAQPNDADNFPENNGADAVDGLEAPDDLVSSDEDCELSSIPAEESAALNLQATEDGERDGDEDDGFPRPAFYNPFKCSNVPPGETAAPEPRKELPYKEKKFTHCIGIPIHSPAIRQKIAQAQQALDEIYPGGSYCISAVERFHVTVAYIKVPPSQNSIQANAKLVEIFEKESENFRQLLLAPQDGRAVTVNGLFIWRYRVIAADVANSDFLQAIQQRVLNAFNRDGIIAFRPTQFHLTAVKMRKCHDQKILRNLVQFIQVTRINEHQTAEAVQLAATGKPLATASVHREASLPREQMLAAQPASWDRFFFELVERNGIASERLDAMEKARQELESILQTIYPASKLHAFGSYVTGLATRSSDLDLLLQLDDSSALSNPHEFLAKLASQLKKCDRFLSTSGPKVPKYIILESRVHEKVKIPILRIRKETSGLEIDISCQGYVAVYNSLILKEYVSLSPIVQQLLLGLKLLRSELDFGLDNDHQCFSLYACAIMAIYALQRTGEYNWDNNFLPNLQANPGETTGSVEKCGEEMFHENGKAFNVFYQNVSELPADKQLDRLFGFGFNSISGLSSLSVWRDMLRELAEFDYNENVISIRLDQTRIPKSDRRLSPGLFARDACFVVEGPFDVSYNLTMAVQPWMAEQWTEAITAAYERADIVCRGGQYLSSLLGTTPSHSEMYDYLMKGIVPQKK